MSESEPSVITILNWASLYEPSRHDQRRNGPLKYVQWRVHVATTGDYRRLAATSGDDLAASLGLFGKLLELAADQPRGLRDGTVYNDHHEAATVSQIAFLSMFTEDLVRRCLSHLVAARWVSVTQPATTGDTPRQPAPQQEQEQELKRKHEQERKQEQESDQGVALNGLESGSNQGHAAQQSPHTGPPPGHNGVGMTCLMRVMGHLGVVEPPRQEQTPRARQARGDRTTLERIIRAVVIDVDVGDARKQAEQLEALARCMAARRPGERMSAFVGEAKRKWPQVSRVFVKGSIHA